MFRPARPFADLVDRRHRLRGDERVVERGVDRREDEDPLGLREQAGGERHRIEHALVEVRLAAVADPACDREHEVDPDLVGEPAERQVVVPGRLPAILDLRHGHAGGAVGREEAELEVLAVEQRLCHGVLLLYGDSGGRPRMRPACMTRGGSVGDGRRDDAADEDDVVAAVVLGVHRALERGGRTVEERRTDEPAGDREPVELLGALARELPGERFLVGGEEVQGEAGRLEPDVEAARAPVDAPENERRLLRDRERGSPSRARRHARPDAPR